MRRDNGRIGKCQGAVRDTECKSLTEGVAAIGLLPVRTETVKATPARPCCNLCAVLHCCLRPQHSPLRRTSCWSLLMIWWVPAACRLPTVSHWITQTASEHSDSCSVRPEIHPLSLWKPGIYYGVQQMKFYTHTHTHTHKKAFSVTHLCLL
jgi:hypothetical protein